MNPDTLRMNPQAVEFVKAFFSAKKPVGGHLSRGVDGYRSGRRERPHHDVMAIAEIGYSKRRG